MLHIQISNRVLKLLLFLLKFLLFDKLVDQLIILAQILPRSQNHTQHFVFLHCTTPIKAVEQLCTRMWGM